MIRQYQRASEAPSSSSDASLDAVWVPAKQASSARRHAGAKFIPSCPKVCASAPHDCIYLFVFYVCFVTYVLGAGRTGGCSRSLRRTQTCTPLPPPKKKCLKSTHSVCFRVQPFCSERHP